MSDHPDLVRGLGIYSATSVVAGTMIGTGIFVVPSIMLGYVETPAMVLVVWVLAGVLSLFGALGYAELGAAIPQAGGEYVYLNRAYGRLAGFLYGWTYSLIAKPASIAAIATGFALYFSYFFPNLRDVALEVPFGAFRLAITGLQLVAVALIAFLSVVNVLGVRRSGVVQTLFTASKLGVLGVLVVVGLLLGEGSFSHFRQAAGVEPGRGFAAAFGLAMVSALWAYDGWNNLSMVAGEVTEPHRTIPRALIFGTLLVIVAYLLTNLAYFYVLAPPDAVQTRTVAADAARRLLGGAGGAFISVGVMISTFAGVNGSILSGSRIPFAQARDGLFPASLARIHPRYRTPAVAICVQAVVAGLFALTGQYEALFTKVIFSEWLFYALATAGIFILRRRLPDLVRPYHTWGYPIVPAIFVAVALLLLVNTFNERRTDSLWGLVLMASGIPVYFMWNLWRRRT